MRDKDFRAGALAWEIIGAFYDIETIATGPSVTARRRLRKRYGPGRWRKCKGCAMVRLADGTIV